MTGKESCLCQGWADVQCQSCKWQGELARTVAARHLGQSAAYEAGLHEIHEGSHHWRHLPSWDRSLVLGSVVLPAGPHPSMCVALCIGLTMLQPHQDSVAAGLVQGQGLTRESGVGG